MNHCKTVMNTQLVSGSPYKASGGLNRACLLETSSPLRGKVGVGCYVVIQAFHPLSNPLPSREREAEAVANWPMNDLG